MPYKFHLYYGLLLLISLALSVTYAQTGIDKNLPAHYLSSSSSEKELREQADRYRIKNYYPQYINTLFLLKHLYEENNSRQKLVYILSEIGDVYFKWGVYEKSTEYYENASDPFYEKISSPSFQKEIALKNADANRLLSHYNKAISLYKLVLSKWEKELSQKEKSSVANYLSQIYKKTETYAEAAFYEQKVLDYQLSLKDSVAIANSYNNLGAIFKKLNKNNAALSYFIKAFAYYPKHISQGNLAIILLNIGIAYQSEDKYDNAEKHFFMALAINQAQKNSEESARTCNYIASNYLFLKEYNEAIAYAEKAETVGKQLHLFDLLEVSYRILWKAHELQKDNGSALQSYRQYVAVKDTLLIRNKNAKDELANKLREAEKLESRIQTLLSENELQNAELNRVQLENKNKNTELELIQQSNELQKIRSVQLQLEQEKKIDRLELVEQTLISKSRDKELSLFKQQVLAENKERQAKIEALRQQNTIHKLEITQKEISLKNQRLVQYILLLTIIGGLLLAVLLFNRYKLSQAAVKERLKRKASEVEQRFLRAQMNPHFIFNALNSIQYYITSHDNKSAARYLAKFSNLIRHILESSRHQFISLREEIKILKVYLDLEQLRFAEKFSYHIDIDESLDDDFVSIPPMITQPYIENAILHGIIPLAQNGELSVSFIKNNNCILCTITDNGIGRKASSLLQQHKNTTKHQSIAMELTRDRIALMKDGIKGEYKIIITDLENDEHIALGTKVEIWIPYLSS